MISRRIGKAGAQVSRAPRERLSFGKGSVESFAYSVFTEPWAATATGSA